MCVVKPQKIQSDQTIEIESPFKVTAGPGAGKTHWLVVHIKNVLWNSKRLGRTGKIACITYTNQGVKEIRDRLGEVAGRVQVGTIHSFLFLNVVKPYAFLLKDNDGRNLINLRKLDGHDDHILLPNIIYKWKKITKQLYLNDDAKVRSALEDLDWHIENNDLVLYPRKRWLLRINAKLSIRRDSLIEYKKLYWNSGQIHHEDVLYFSYRLMYEYPKIVEILSAKFPYVFIDEFQDTHPLQTAIIKEIAKAQTIVGVIGDPAQSIFSFMGAMRNDYLQFNLHGQREYIIEGNRRSTNQIIQVLNNLRSDITQNGLRNEDGEKPELLVGNKHDILKNIQQLDPAILVRNNTLLNALRKEINQDQNLWDEYRVIDADYNRVDLLFRVFCSLDHLRLKNFRESLIMIKKIFRKQIDGTVFSPFEQKSKSIRLLNFLWKTQDDFLGRTILEFNNGLFAYLMNEFNIKVGARIQRGKIAEFASSHFSQELLDEIRVSDEVAKIRTIHKAKGTEFDTVIVLLENEDQVRRVVDADLDHREDESRIYYVALSRARNHLFLSVPSISVAAKAKAEEMGFVVRYQD